MLTSELVTCKPSGNWDVSCFYYSPRRFLFLLFNKKAPSTVSQTHTSSAHSSWSWSPCSPLWHWTPRAPAGKQEFGAGGVGDRGQEKVEYWMLAKNSGSHTFAQSIKLLCLAGVCVSWGNVPLKECCQAKNQYFKEALPLLDIWVLSNKSIRTRISFSSLEKPC